MNEWMQALPQRFWDKVLIPAADRERHCWLWVGAITTAGYGSFRMGKVQYPHRLTYEAAGGELIAGMHIDHLCRNRNCINPHHLEQVTPRENNYRGNSIPAQNARKTRCKYGHEFTPENTIMGTNWNGRAARRCRTCTEGTDSSTGSRHDRAGSAQR